MITIMTCVALSVTDCYTTDISELMICVLKMSLLFKQCSTEDKQGNEHVEWSDEVVADYLAAV